MHPSRQRTLFSTVLRGLLVVLCLASAPYALATFEKSSATKFRLLPKKIVRTTAYLSVIGPAPLRTAHSELPKPTYKTTPPALTLYAPPPPPKKTSEAAKDPIAPLAPIQPASKEIKPEDFLPYFQTPRDSDASGRGEDLRFLPAPGTAPESRADYHQK